MEISCKFTEKIPARRKDKGKKNAQYFVHDSIFVYVFFSCLTEGGGRGAGGVGLGGWCFLN